MKANHNYGSEGSSMTAAVLAVSKVLNLKANHNSWVKLRKKGGAVLAVSKVLNLKANHNALLMVIFRLPLY